MDRFRDKVRVLVKFRVRIRVWAWSGVTLCPCAFCRDPTRRNLSAGNVARQCYW